MSHGEREDQGVPREVGNPYLDAYERWCATPHDPEVREDLIRTFGFAIPSPEALLLIAAGRHRDRRGHRVLGAPTR